MHRTIMVFLAVSPIIVFAQDPPLANVETLIKNLGSTNFKVRQEAVAALKERPDSARALKNALKSPDAEIARRAADVLAYIDRKPVRDLQSAVDNAQLERFVDLMVAWPEDKFETEAWTLLCTFSDKLRKLHEKSGNELPLSIDRISFLEGRDFPLRTHGKRITALATSLEEVEKKSRAMYCCADEVELILIKENPPKSYRWAYHNYTMAIIAKRSVRTELYSPQTIFCNGRVELVTSTGGALVVSAGDVVIDSAALNNSLIIAKGNIIIKRNNIERTRLIAGKKVITDDADRDFDKSVIISENDLNPLGYIRWADAAKVKSPPLGK